MTFQAGQDEFGAVCPYLGLADDADSHATYATEAHRCYRLPNPTRIATGHQESYCLGAGHVSCPVYLGEGVPGAAAPAAAVAGAGTGGRPPAPPQSVRGPQGRQTTAPPRPRPAAPQGNGREAPRPGRRPANAGAIGPRPRSGGVSMPVATIGLFALAIVVIGLAFAINQMVGDGGSDKLSPQDVVGTTTAQKTQAAAASQPTQPPAPTTAANRTPGANQTPGVSPTAAANRTPGGNTYTVKSGDTCSGIAAAKNITLQQLLTANNMAESDCPSLKIDQVLKLP